MKLQKLFETAAKKEKALLVGIEIKGSHQFLSANDSLLELEQLANTAGLEVIACEKQKLDAPHPSTFIGKGKVEEIKALSEGLKIDLIVFDEELSPRHFRELEEEFGSNIRVIDRTTLILDIFAQHAQTREGQLQVELAQYEYFLPRLTRAWTHLARQAGGGGGARRRHRVVPGRAPRLLDDGRPSFNSRLPFGIDQFEQILLFQLDLDANDVDNDLHRLAPSHFDLFMYQIILL